MPPSIASSLSNLKLRRLGRPTAGRNRPLLIETPSPDIALNILKHKPDDATFESQILFKSDQTQAQQLHLKNLRVELESITKSGDSTKTIKYINGIPKIVNRNFRSLAERSMSNNAGGNISERERSKDKVKQIPSIVIGQ